MTAIQDEIDKLATLGSSRAVAMYLASLGVRGVCGNAYRCALAVYLAPAMRADGWTDISVGPLGLVPYNLGDGIMEGPPCALPRVLTEFIGEFDAHEYPELVG